MNLYMSVKIYVRSCVENVFVIFLQMRPFHV